MTRTLDILDLLHNYYLNSKEIQLLNTYRGMPISYPAQVLSVSEENVLVGVHQHQAVCLELQRSTFINLGFPLTIKASVSSGNVATKLFNLTNIHVAEQTIGKREVIRVNPKEPLPVVISTNGSRSNNIIAELIDLSIIGIGVYGLSVSLTEIKKFQPGTNIKVRLLLPDKNQMEIATIELTIDGKVVNVIPVPEEKRIRLGIKINPDLDTRGTIASYISQRQVEIITELRLLHQTLIQLTTQN